MSSNGTRKLTLGWEGRSGGLSRDSSGAVVVEQAPSGSSAAIAIDSAAIVVGERAVPPPWPKQRPGLSTLETFNHEKVILERRLEGDVAYIDEKPPRRWRHAAAFLVTAAIVGGGGVFALSRHRAAVAGHVEHSSPTVATVASAASSAPVAPLQSTAASAAASAGSSQPVAIAATPASPDDSAADDSEQLRGSQSASRKVKSPSGHSKHARSASRKSGHHGANRHAGTSKHQSRQE